MTHLSQINFPFHVSLCFGDKLELLADLLRKSDRSTTLMIIPLSSPASGESTVLVLPNYLFEVEHLMKVLIICFASHDCWPFFSFFLPIFLLFCSLLLPSFPPPSPPLCPHWEVAWGGVRGRVFAGNQT